MEASRTLSAATQTRKYSAIFQAATWNQKIPTGTITAPNTSDSCRVFPYAYKRFPLGLKGEPNRKCTSAGRKISPFRLA